MQRWAVAQVPGVAGQYYIAAIGVPSGLCSKLLGVGACNSTSRLIFYSQDDGARATS